MFIVQRSRGSQTITGTPWPRLRNFLKLSKCTNYFNVQFHLFPILIWVNEWYMMFTLQRSHGSQTITRPLRTVLEISQLFWNFHFFHFLFHRFPIWIWSNDPMITNHYRPYRLTELKYGGAFMFPCFIYFLLEITQFAKKSNKKFFLDHFGPFWPIPDT